MPLSDAQGPLTSEERDALSEVIASGYYTPDLDDPIFATVESIVAARVRAASRTAWLEGYESGVVHTLTEPFADEPPNPYDAGDDDE